MKCFSLLLTVLLGLSATARAELPLSCSLFNGNLLSDGPAIPLGHYQVKFSSCLISGQNWIGIREFTSHQKNYVLLTQPNTLKTQIVALNCLQCTDIKLSEIPDSIYKRGLKDQVSPPFPMVDAGITHSRTNEGLYLTVDLCPSHKNFDQVIFQNEKVKSRNDFPVAVSLSGGWMSRYESDFRWMKDQVLNHQLDVVWVNHSYTHPYKKGVPNKDNFLLTQNVNFNDEVLKQEQYMISNGVTPSVFFRFPGLISNQDLMVKLGQFGLISLGSDAWLALGQRPTPGSLILIHGNGNEEAGVHLFLKLLDSIADVGVFKNLNQVLRPGLKKQN